jgi:4-diphosphocytidyl-2-C-methyl-D-erythritol kinase
MNEFAPESLRAGCKINISLRIVGKRADGYHELDSVFCPVLCPADKLHLSMGQGQGLHLRFSGLGAEKIDCQHNTVSKAYTAFSAATGYTPPLHLHVEKAIPSGAGLGGGSSDAASLLLWLNKHAPQALSPAALAAVALGIGADVPFFLYNRPCRVRGIGEQLLPCTVEALYGKSLVLLCPPVHVATALAYQAWDALPQKKSCAKSLTTFQNGAKHTNSCGDYLVNDFERAIFPQYPQLAALKQSLLQQGAYAAVMSGSGSSIAGFFASQAKAEAAAQSFADVNVFLQHDFLVGV